MKKKLTAAALLCIALTILFSVTVFGGWEEQRKWKYRDENGDYKTDQWFTDSSGKTYYLDEEGYMVTGWLKKDGRIWFFNEEGDRVTGIAEIDGKAWYFQEDGSLYAGDRTIGDRLFHFTEDGVPCPEGTMDYAPAYNSGGTPTRESGEYDRTNPGHYVPFLVLFLMAAWMGWFGRRTAQGVEMLFVFAAVLLTSTPLLVRYLIYGHDLTFHLNRILGIRESLKGRMFPVRINGFTFEGYGYPDPVFYPHLFLYIPAVLSLMGVPFGASVHTFLLLVNWSGALALYFCGKKMFDCKSAGCISSMLYTMGIYRLCNEYIRAAYGEVLAMVFFPLVIWGLYELFYGQEKYWILLPIGFTGIFQSHLISTVLVAAGCVIFGLAGIRQLRKKNRLIALFKVMAVTLCMNLWTLIPLLQYMSTEMDTSSLQFHAEETLTPWPLYLTVFPLAEGSTPEVGADMSSAMPLSLGLALICGIVLLLAFRFVKKEKLPVRVRVLLWTGIGLLVIASDLVPWHLLVKVPVLKTASSYIQFLWRFMAIASCCLSLAVSYGVCQMWNKKNRGLLYIGVLTAAMISSQYFIAQVNKAPADVWTEYNVSSAIKKMSICIREPGRTALTDRLMFQERM